MSGIEKEKKATIKTSWTLNTSHAHFVKNSNHIQCANNVVSVIFKWNATIWMNHRMTAVIERENEQMNISWRNEKKKKFVTQSVVGLFLYFHTIFANVFAVELFMCLSPIEYGVIEFAENDKFCINISKRVNLVNFNGYFRNGIEISIFEIWTTAFYKCLCDIR